MYPIALDVAGRTCVVVGGGVVATRKVRGLLNAGAQVVIISPAITATLHELVSDHRVTWLDEGYQSGNLEHLRPFIVIAATNQSEVNRLVAGDARALGTLVNIADGSAASDFHNMTTSQHSPITIALYTSGTSPALAHHLLDVIDRSIGDEYATLAGWLGELRPQISQQIESQPQRKAFYEAVIHSDALILLQQGKPEAAYQQVQSLVQEWTCAH